MWRPTSANRTRLLPGSTRCRTPWPATNGSSTAATSASGSPTTTTVSSTLSSPSWRGRAGRAAPSASFIMATRRLRWTACRTVCGRGCRPSSAAAVPVSSPLPPSSLPTPSAHTAAVRWCASRPSATASWCARAATTAPWCRTSMWQARPPAASGPPPTRTATAGSAVSAGWVCSSATVRGRCMPR